MPFVLFLIAMHGNLDIHLAHYNSYTPLNGILFTSEPKKKKDQKRRNSVEYVRGM